MLGWKLGQAFTGHAKFKELGKYGALYRQVARTYGDDEARRLKELADGSAPSVAIGPGGAHVAPPAAAAAMLPPAVGAPAGLEQLDAHAHPPQLEGGAVPDLLAHPIQPLIPAPQLVNVPQQAHSEPVEVRGVCDGCGQNVMSNHEGRKREGDKYYHPQCVKGNCGSCGRIVHANSERMKVAGVYWHKDCVHDSQWAD